MSIIFTVAPTTLLGIDQIRDLENKHNLLVYNSTLLATLSMSSSILCITQIFHCRSSPKSLAPLHDEQERHHRNETYRRHDNSGILATHCIDPRPMR
jgi:hypothetical protein